MRHISKLSIILFFLNVIILNGQERIDGMVEFQDDPEKKYSLYIPSNYSEDTPNALMVGLHPFNTSRWDAVSWCDTLLQFAESSNLILFCPDGGIDGKIDDDIDTSFTSFILDSMSIWYNIAPDEIYLMGFSWGGKTTYSYGLRNTNKFKGYLPIGAAVSGPDEIEDIVFNAIEKPFYLVHGSFDSPESRYTEMVESLNNNGACVEGLLMDGVNHTIDFPNRNEILKTGYDWLKSFECVKNDVFESEKELDIIIYPNPSGVDNKIQIKNIGRLSQVSILDYQGNHIRSIKLTGESEIQIELASGTYFISFLSGNERKIKKVVVI